MWPSLLGNPSPAVAYTHLKRALRDVRVEERDVTDVELAQLFPDVSKDSERLRFAA